MMTPGGKQNIVIEQRGNYEKLTEARAKPGKDGVAKRYPHERSIIMNLSLLEQETIITYNAQEDFAEVYTCYPPMIRKLDKLTHENPEEWKVLRADAMGKTYTCPKGLVSLRCKTKKMNLTDEQRARLSEQGKASQEARRLRSTNRGTDL